jgi:hypothetical protein
LKQSLLFIYLINLCSLYVFSRSPQTKKEDAATTKYKPEIFNSGFIDVMNNGQVNASARFIRLFIGEPGKFSIPLSFYGGVSNNQFQNQKGPSQFSKSNDHLVNQYINPMSGLVNIGIEDIVFSKKKDSALTKFGFIYQIGERVLNGIRIGPANDPQTGKPTNFLNAFATTGVYFQTGAWKKTNSKNVGIFWLAARYHACFSNTKKIKEFLPNIETNGFYHGYSVGFGIEINNLVNIKAIYYKYQKRPEIDYGLPIYQFSFNYTMNKNQ